MKTITLARLKELGACADKLLLFEELFGAEVAVTEEMCIKHSSDFDFNWAANNLLSATAFVDYERVRDTARAEYERVSDTAWDEYARVSATAWAEYKRVRDTARAEYERIRATALVEYERVCAALVEYERVIAVAFCRLFND